MSATPRERALARLHLALDADRSLLATGAGSGLAAAAAAAGGADLLVVYNSGRFRTAGHGSLSGLLPFADANALVFELAREVLSAVDDVPVVAGVCAQNPLYDLDRFVHELRELGAAGIQNFPTIGLYGREFREDLEATGISFEREVELIRAARRAGLLTCAFVCDEDSARRMALAGVDVLAPHLGVTRSDNGASALVDAAAQVDSIASAARAVRDDLIVLFHGGPAVTPEDVQRVLELADDLHGFFAASSVERLPVQAAVEDAARKFTGLRRGAQTSPLPAAAPDFEAPPPALPFELSPETLPAYLLNRGIANDGESVEVEELGGGLSNVVLGWRVGDRSGVVKQSRPRLRVEEEWLSDVRRVLNERDAIALLAAGLPRGSVPELTFSDDEALAFGMASAPRGAILWKPELVEGRLDPARARQAGRLLHAIHEYTRDDPIVARRFTARPLLDQNRLDPWYRAAARQHPDVAEVIEYAIERLLTVRRVLVHGDFVPKNIFLLDDGLLLLDYEVVHFGNPGYDVATFLNHMLLKGFRGAEHKEGFTDLAATFWHAYAKRLDADELELVEQETLLQLGALMLARVDGKSKVEYLVGTAGAEEARAFALWLLRNRPGSVREVLEAYRATVEPPVGALR
jgi:predicted TIM-barrel enzyme/aminoglycoside phosphotransferase (APT) family kinase protein